ncbi:MAG: hypothetical protein KF701_00930 [Anaerolineales bacterium]|nr:MAG: hypothetical protein KF701_00930 [Anaerolineales bacterium]
MTAELVVMNLEGVALAADSLVTVGREKTFDTVTKIHQLAHGLPVAIMLYNAGRFMELPWEVVVQEYRRHFATSRKKYLKLEDFVDDFLEFLKVNEAILSTEDQQSIVVARISDSLVEAIVTEILDQFKKDAFEMAQRISETRIEQIIENVISSRLKSISDKPVAFENDLEAFETELRKRHTDIILGLIKQHFDNLPLTEDQRNAVVNFIVMSFLRHWENPLYTGVVFAGYGVEDLTPKCISLDLEFLICGQIKHSNRTTTSIDFRTNSAAIIPYAQDDVVHTILSGRHPNFLHDLGKRLVREVGKERADELIKEVEQARFYGYTAPIMQALTSLPKEDLPLVAETIINLTSFMRKVSMRLETVGGPTDVALITKKDGFIWIKRKHYFEMQYNPRFIQ